MSRVHRRRLLVLVTLLSLSSSMTGTVVAGSAQASARGVGKRAPATFGIGPASKKGIDGRSFLSFLTSPGAKIQDHVALINLTYKPLAISAYPVDATNGTSGALGFAARAAARRDAGSWIKLKMPSRRNTVVVPPRKTVVLPVDISVPANTQPGDHVAGIVAAVNSLVTNKQGRKVDLEQRVALRTFFRISGDLGPRLAVEDLHVSIPTILNPFGTSTATVTYSVRNTGNVRLSGRQRVIISGLFATSEVSPPRVPVLFPGGVVHYTVRLPDVYPQLRMNARVVIKPITVLGDVDATLPASFEKVQGFWAIPWGQLVILLVMIVVAVVLLRRWRRRRQAKVSAHAAGRQAREEASA